jgi:hypothetical protein
VSVLAVDGEGQRSLVPLFVGDRHLADLSLQYQCVLDASGRFLKTEASAFGLYLVEDRQPLARLEYTHINTTAPTAHWQFHGEREAFAGLLREAQETGARSARDPSRLSALHFPLGGERWRPCLEDFLQFLIVECGVDKNERWREAIEGGRELWRRLQMRALVRDLQVEAADILQQHGWAVSPPKREQTENTRTLHTW